jgi:hypothetical protein
MFPCLAHSTENSTPFDRRPNNSSQPVGRAHSGPRFTRQPNGPALACCSGICRGLRGWQHAGNCAKLLFVFATVASAISTIDDAAAKWSHAANLDSPVFRSRKLGTVDCSNCNHRGYQLVIYKP